MLVRRTSRVILLICSFPTASARSGTAMAASKPAAEVKDTRAEAFEKEYKESHPNGPYPPVEIHPKGEARSD